MTDGLVGDRVLKSGAIQFKPELPARRKEILESLTMATFTKIWLRFDHAFWNSSAYTCKFLLLSPKKTA